MIGTGNTGNRKTAELKCSQVKQLFSPYLDGAVTGTEMLALQDHLSGCPGCHREYQALRRTQQLLATVGRPKAPADLGLKLRLAISREAAVARRGRFEGVRYGWRMPSRLSWFPRPPGF